MSDSNIFDKKPAVLDLKAGTHYWCQCGFSKKQPFCDGSHSGTSFGPLAFSLEADKKTALCLCKQTKNPPYCDGTHSKL